MQYSLLDQRPGQRMAKLATERGVGLLCYGTVLGGLLSEKWLGKPRPSKEDFTTVSEMKVDVRWHPHAIVIPEPANLPLAAVLKEEFSA